jgi:hypothetical protein
MSDGKYLNILSLTTRMLIKPSFVGNYILEWTYIFHSTELGLRLGSMDQNFTDAMLEAIDASVPLARRTRLFLAVSSQIKFIIPQKNDWSNKDFGNKAGKLKPDHGSFV